MVPKNIYIYIFFPRGETSFDFILFSLVMCVNLKQGTENAKMDFYGSVITKIGPDFLINF